MGLTASSLAPSAPPLLNHLRDSVVLSDGRAPLASSMWAVLGEGRFIFKLGEEMVITGIDEDHKIASRFELERVDLLLGERHRFDDVGDLFEFGCLCGFYALSNSAVVIIDHNRDDEMLRQRVIALDTVTMKAACTGHRGYAVDFAPAEGIVMGEKVCLVLTPSLPAAGLVFPLNPLSPASGRDISRLLVRANAHTRAHYAPADGAEENEASPRLATDPDAAAPFFVSDTVLGFFILPDGEQDTIDPLSVLLLDLNNRSMVLREATASRCSAFPLAADGRPPIKTEGGRAAEGEVYLKAEFARASDCWQVIAAAWIDFTIEFILTLLFAIAARRRWELLGRICDTAIEQLIEWKERLLEPTDETCRFGRLNTRTMEWAEMKISLVEPDGESEFIFTDDGSVLINATASSLSSCDRAIGGDASRRQQPPQLERYRLFGNPFSVPRLAKLALARLLQQRDQHRRLRPEQLTQIVARME